MHAEMGEAQLWLPSETHTSQLAIVQHIALLAASICASISNMFRAVGADDCIGEFLETSWELPAGEDSSRCSSNTTETQAGQTKQPGV
jgi:hypothetical protein